ncbi:hypothetical protein BH10ACI3_BH10ACI3_28260 [soil metagenome]
MNMVKRISIAICLLFAFLVNISAQEMPPAPGAPKAVSVPAIKTKTLANGLTVAVVERKGVPLVAVKLMINAGVTSDDMKTAGLANMSMSMLTKGTITRNATKIANDIEFLGGSVDTAVGMDNSGVSMSTTTDKLAAGLSILSDVVLHPTFPAKELTLLKSQAIDELAANLKQPSFLAGYVASAYSFYLTPAGGTPESLKAMSRKDVLGFYRDNFTPDSATLIFVGDITTDKAFSMAESQFGKWGKPKVLLMAPETEPVMEITQSAASVSENKKREADQPLLKRLLVIDLPNSGQAAVSFVKHMPYVGHVVWNEENKAGDISKNYFPGVVFNTVLGGGYSSRLNLEIRIKRGLSYGAGSSMSWRAYDSRFSARAQTKNESAAQVAELVLTELSKLAKTEVDTPELTARQAVVVGNFGRGIETNAGMLGAISDLFANWLDASELDSYMQNVQSVDAKKVREFASQNLNGGDLILVGDYSIFKDDLAKRFPKIKVQVIKAADLDLSKDSLQK